MKKKLMALLLTSVMAIQAGFSVASAEEFTSVAVEENVFESDGEEISPEEAVSGEVSQEEITSEEAGLEEVGSEEEVIEAEAEESCAEDMSVDESAGGSPVSLENSMDEIIDSSEENDGQAETVISEEVVQEESILSEESEEDIVDVMDEETGAAAEFASGGDEFSDTDRVAESGSTPDYNVWLCDSIRDGLSINGVSGGDSLYKMFLNFQTPVYEELGGLLLEDVPLLSVSSIYKNVLKQGLYTNQKLIYETLIVDYLKYESKSEGESIDAEKINRANSFLIKIFDGLAEIYEQETIRSLTDNFMNLTVEDAEKYLDNLDKVVGIKDTISAAKNLAKNSKELVEITADLLALEEMKMERVQLLLYARNACQAMDSPNKYFIEACDEVIAYLEGTSVFDNYAVSSGADQIMGVVIDKVWEKLCDANVLLKALDFGTLGLDALFDIEGQADNNLKLSLLYTMDCYMKLGLFNASSAYLNHKASDEALAFTGCFKGYLEFQMYANSFAKEWIDGVMNGGTNSYALEYLLFNENISNAENLKAWCDSENNTRSSALNLISTYQDIYSGLYLSDEYKEVMNYTPSVDPDKVTEDDLDISDDVQVSSRKEVDGGSCGTNVYWKYYDDGSLLIYGSGAMSDYVYNTDKKTSAPWESYLSDGNRKCTILSEVTSIGKNAFAGCNGLVDITIADSVKNIGTSAFYACQGLKTLNLPNGVKSIGANAFAECNNLTNVNLSEGLISIGRTAFENCVSIVDLKIPDSVEEIEGSFYGCSALEKVSLPANLKHLGSGSFLETKWFAGQKDGLLYLENWLLGYKSGDGLDASKFNNESNILKLPQGTVGIATSALYDNDSFKTVIFPESVKYICNDCFFGAECYSYVFEGQPEVIEDRSIAYTWNSVVKKDSLLFGKSGGSIEEYAKKYGLQVISTDKYEYDERFSVGFDAENNGLVIGAIFVDKTAVIPDYMYGFAVTCIDNAACETSKNIENLTLSNTIKDIKNYAFADCKNLTELVIPDSVVTLGIATFNGCTGLKEITLGTGLMQMETGVFANCESLEKVTFNSLALEEIPEKTFSNCYNLKNISFPKGLKRIGNYAFDGCKLNSLDFPEGLTSIGKYAFGGCDLSSITFPDSLTSIGSYAFFRTARNISLMSVKLPEKLTDIGERAFGSRYGTVASVVIIGKKGSFAETYARDCGFTFIEDGEHLWSSWETIEQPTVFTSAKQTRRCSICKKVETRNYGSKLTPVLKLNSTSLTLKKGQSTSALKISGLAEGDSIKSVVSGNKKILKVVSWNKNGTVKLKAQKKTGTAKLTVTLQSGLKKTIKVKVQSGTVKTTKLSVKSKKVTLKKGKTAKLAVSVAPITSQQKVTYSSSNKKVVTVTAKGVIKAKKTGTAKITVKSGSKKVTVKVTVK